MTSFFSSRAEAEAFATAHGVRAVDVSVTSRVLPETFWAALRASACAAIDDAQRVTRHTERWMVSCDVPAKAEVVGQDPQDDHVGRGLGND